MGHIANLAAFAGLISLTKFRQLCDISVGFVGVGSKRENLIYRQTFGSILIIELGVKSRQRTVSVWRINHGLTQEPSGSSNTEESCRENIRRN
jgi:hypothetical protein